jgi:hypothetical protein
MPAMLHLSSSRAKEEKLMLLLQTNIQTQEYNQHVIKKFELQKIQWKAFLREDRFVQQHSK